MKVNLDYYKELEDVKQIGEEYEEVRKKVEDCVEEDFSKTLDSKAKIKNVLALSDVRENILNVVKSPLKRLKVTVINIDINTILPFYCNNMNENRPS